MRSPPRLELSGSEPSHEPQSRSNNSSEKSTPAEQARDKTAIAATAKPGVFTEGMRKELSAYASDGAVLQRGVPAEGQAVVAMEKSATVAAIGEGAKEAEAAKRASSRTAAACWRCIIPAGKWCAWVIRSRITGNFFCDSCDRPGCYEGFQRSRRSPLQRFCCYDCRRALERVLERERRWKERGQRRNAQLGKIASSAPLRL